MDGRIIILKERINKNLKKNWTVKDLAVSIDISETYLQKLFKDSTGMSPIKYLHHLRYEKSRDLLESRKFLRIQEICHEVGINDQTHFTRDFKKKYGKTPSRYRKDYWEKYAIENEIG
jgi:two-component system response regulator YesN